MTRQDGVVVGALVSGWAEILENLATKLVDVVLTETVETPVFTGNLVDALRFPTPESNPELYEVTSYEKMPAELDDILDLATTMREFAMNMTYGGDE